ncbi:MAG: LemA family protein [Spirochaetes bacterium]|nr:LemA family protein [Spirochaetota bacterium]
MIGLFIIIGIAVLVLLWIVSIYNRFIRLRNQADEAYSGIDVQLKRRYDLIPNIVETVKGYAKHEKETFNQVTQARAQAINATGVKQQAEAENMLTGALKSLFAVAENYPELKANQNFMDLQSTLSEIEDQIQNARRYYNAVVRELNIKCESFPSVIVANMFSFKKREFFEIAGEERQNVQVKF